MGKHVPDVVVDELRDKRKRRVVSHSTFFVDAIDGRGRAEDEDERRHGREHEDELDEDGRDHG
jgi:hypothetical protein